MVQTVLQYALFILFPIGMYVTYKAMRDAKALNFERLKIVFSYIGALFSRLIPSR